MSVLDRFIEVAPPTVPKQEKWLGIFSHFSASSLRMLSRCPEQFRQRYVLGRKERPGAALTIGSTFHDAMRFNYEPKIESGEDRPIAEVLEYLNDAAWPQCVEQDGGVDEIRWDEGQKPDDARHDAERMTRAYHHAVAPRVQPVSAERKFSIEVEGVVPPLIGYMDVVTADSIIDTKTGKQVQRKPDANWRMQGRIYQLRHELPVHFHSVSRAKTPSIATPLDSELMAIAPDPVQAEEGRRIIRDFAASVEWYVNRYGPDDTWPTTGIWQDLRGGPACNYCGFQPTCPAWRHAPV